MASSDRSTRASTPGRFLRFALTGLALSACAAAALAGTGNGDLTDTNINYVGRWDKTNSTTYRSYWNGAYVSTKFTGTTVKVKLAEKTVFMAIVDGVPNTYWDRVGTVDLTPTPLANGTHTLKIIAKHEKVELPFQGLVLDAGASTVKPDTQPLVEFIGDSITSGVTTTDLAVSDYAWLTGERLGATPRFPTPASPSSTPRGPAPTSSRAWSRCTSSCGRRTAAPTWPAPATRSGTSPTTRPSWSS
jgi:hypothetical protein